MHGSNGLGAWCGSNGLVHSMGLMVWVHGSNGLGVRSGSRVRVRVWVHGSNGLGLGLVLGLGLGAWV